MPPKKKQEETGKIGLDDVFEGVKKAPVVADVKVDVEDAAAADAKEPVRRRKIVGPPRDLELDKKKCLEKLEIIERLKQARINRGAAPKEAPTAAPAPAPAPPAPAPVVKEAPKPAPVPVAAPAPQPPTPAAPKKIIKSTFTKPIWG
jgi:hypothetical protein